MQIKKKDMQRSTWDRVLEKEYYYEAFTYNNYQGIISLIIIQSVSSPLIIHYDFNDIMIADNDYKWIQIALKDQFFWITAMFDQDNQLIEIYFDITKRNYFIDQDNPYFLDLFLDIVVTPKGDIYKIDEDELLQALKEKTIDQEEYNLAIATADTLVAYLNKNRYKLIDTLNIKLEELEIKLRKGL